MEYPSIAISVQQPWAFFLVNGFKPVENRTWPIPDKYIGARVLIQASARPLFPLAAARETLAEMHALYGIPGGWRFPEMGRDVGGIVGMVRLVGCTRDHVSPWAVPGQWHWQTAEAKPLPFMPCKGQLGFFRVDYRPAGTERGSLIGGAA
jgi:hypothetical protein